VERPWDHTGMSRKVLPEKGKDDPHLRKILAANHRISGQSLGWEHYEVHEPEPHILLFK